MKIRKITISYSNTKEYTKNKLDLDIYNDNKSISIIKDFTSNYQDKLDEKKEELDEKKEELDEKKEELDDQKELLNMLNNLKRFI